MKEKLIVLTGPTAIGKTNLSIDLAKNLNGEIISSDSMQIYKYMDIGTAKVKAKEAKGIPHHLVDFLEPDIEYTVSDFQKDSSKIITKLNNNNKVPILTGGTGLYINSLVYKLNFAQIPANEEIRNKYENLVEKHGNIYIHDLLAKVDKKSSKKIHPNDIKRVIRALEIYELTGKTMGEYNKNFRKETDKYDLAMICLNMDRQSLYERINTRVDLMIKKGLVEEVKDILNKGYDKDTIALQAIGYKEIISYLENEISLEQAIDDIKQGSRNYAKRQLTWFRRDPRFKWFNIDNYNNHKNLLMDIENYIKNEIKI